MQTPGPSLVQRQALSVVPKFPQRFGEYARAVRILPGLLCAARHAASRAQNVLDQPRLAFVKPLLESNSIACRVLELLGFPRQAS